MTASSTTRRPTRNVRVVPAAPERPQDRAEAASARPRLHNLWRFASLPAPVRGQIAWLLVAAPAAPAPASPCRWWCSGWWTARCATRPGRLAPARRPRAAARPGRGGADLHPPVDAVRLGARHGGGAAQRPLRPPATAAGRFHDRWQSGQLLSRTTSDLSVIRRFLSLRPDLPGDQPGHLHHRGGCCCSTCTGRWALLVAVSAVPLFLISRRFTSHYYAASRRMQDQQGDLATLVEETAQGMRVIKAYGRRPAHGRAGSAAGARALHDTGVGKAPAAGPHLVAVRPGAQRDAGRRAGRRRAAVAARATLTIGELVAFVSLAADADLADRRAGLDHRQRRRRR